MADTDTQITAEDQVSGTKRMELLAPAGDRAALDAALAAGADSVYFGLTALNARRRAKNFTAEELPSVVADIHAKGAKAYLTLNIDLAEREVGLAARILESARRAGVDAVLVRDAALLALRPHFPELAFHFSTQTCMANSADVQAAAALGASRVVLARELALPEIAACAKVPGIETEVFCQGALCFCVSGRCLLSSWIGGRSGNRGTCTSPCRVPWGLDGKPPEETPLSMRDLATAHRMEKLEKTGVAALKIEGRLKNAAWVGQAVGLYRRAIDNPKADRNALLDEAQQLGAYTGRMLTCGYLSGERAELTGTAAGRASAETLDGEEEAASVAAARAEQAQQQPLYDLTLDVEAKGIACRCECLGQTAEWTMPKTVVRRAVKAISLGRILERLEASPCEGFALGLGETNDPDFLMVPRAFNTLIDRLCTALRQAKKAPSQQVRIEISDALRAALDKQPSSPENRLHLGDEPDTARCDPAAAAALVRDAQPPRLVVEGLTVQSLRRIAPLCEDTQLIVALPSVFFEDEIHVIRQLLERCAQQKLTIEVNSWGGWQLARSAGLRMEGGPGLGVLNALAARTLAERRLECAAISLEAERRQIEELSANCPVPCSLTLFGRPPLLVTRVKLAEPQFEGHVLCDRRGCEMTARRERGEWTFRPVAPFDLRGLKNQRIAVAHLAMDLVASPDPVGEWFEEQRPNRERFHFNYDRSLD